MNTQRFFTLLSFLTFSVLGFAQVHSSGAYESFITTQQQKHHIQELTSPKTAGRAAGTIGAAIAGEYIEKEFAKYGLREWRTKYKHEFQIHPDKKAKPGTPPLTGNNIIGYIPAQQSAADYIIIGAHYDHMGMLNGRLFPGADDNASGIAVLLELAKAFSQMAKHEAIHKNIVFVAFDANNMNNAGSKDFVNNLHIFPERINCMINIDQIGSNLAPPGADSNYLLILGNDKLDYWAAEQLSLCNKISEDTLNLDFTYYNSKSFYDIFYRLSDQRLFTEKEIPALLFTSGITKLTNKETDDFSHISFDVLDKRIKLIYKFVYQMLNRK